MQNQGSRDKCQESRAKDLESRVYKFKIPHRSSAKAALSSDGERTSTPTHVDTEAVCDKEVREVIIY